MQKQLASSSSGPVGRCLLATAMLLALGSPKGWAQAAAPQPAWAWLRPGTLLYLDGKPSTLAEIRQLPDAAISSGEGMLLADDYPFANVIAPAAEIITTKANANSPAVLALADRLDLPTSYTEKPATMSAVAPPALAYITRHYPQAWLGGNVAELTQKSTGAVRYRVQLADRWSLFHVDFTPEGEVVEHPLASPVAMLLVLTLGYPHPPVQPTPPAKPYAPVYLDGKLISQEALRTLSPDSLASVLTLQSTYGQLIAPEAAGLGLLVLTTKRGQHQPTAVAFARRAQQMQTIQKLAAHSRKALAEMPALPTPPGNKATEIRYYLNNNPISEAAIEQLDANTIASVDVLQGKPAATYTHDAQASGVVLLTTKQPPQAEADTLPGQGKRVN